MAIFNNFINDFFLTLFCSQSQSSSFVESGNEADDENSSDFVRKTGYILLHNLVIISWLVMYVIVKSKFSMFECKIIIPFIKSNLRRVYINASFSNVWPFVLHF